MQKRLTLVVGLFAGMTLAIGCENLKPIGSRSQSQTGSSTAPAAGAVKMEMYVMSKCPYGVQAVDGVTPVLKEMGNSIDFHLDFIVQEREGQFTSLHGEPEIKGNIVQLCAIKHYPDQSKWLNFLECWNKNWQAIPQGWEPCAQQNGMDKGRISSCAEGNEGKDLLRESMKRAQTAQAQGSPTILVGGERYSGGRAKADLMRAVCDKMGSNKATACSAIPEDIEVKAVVLTDKRCATCRTEGLENNIKSRFFPKLTVKKLDYSEPEGKQLFKDLAITHLPIMVFEPGVEKAERYSAVSRWMLEKGKYKQLRIPAKFDPTAEICDNQIDDTGNGKIDCADPTCQEDLLCRKEVPRQLEVFVMSQCPFGVKALDAMKEVLDNFGKAIKFDVHYIADKTDTGFNALHGQPEVDENIRHLCAKKYYKKNNKYMDYIWCRNKNYRSNEWKPCATDGISAATIEKCFAGEEGKRLLEENITLAKALQIQGSPTWLANNKFKFSGVAAEAIKNNLCQHNKGLPGCDKKLTEQVDAPPAGSCGGS